MIIADFVFDTKITHFAPIIQAVAIFLRYFYGLFNLKKNNYKKCNFQIDNLFILDENICVK